MKPLIILKSLVSGYTRRNGVFVKPHSDKRTKRAELADGQLALFPAPEKKPIPPSPFKGLDPVTSTPDLFDNEPMKPEPAKPAPSQKRAAAGGEHGANGEWYEGGKFIATTDHEKGNKKSKKGTGRQEIEPYKWDHPPEPGMRSIFGASRVFNALENGKMVLNSSVSDHTWGYYHGHDANAVAGAKARYQELADRYNAGERWTNG